MTIYILFTSKGEYYTGITNDFSRRLHEHEQGKSVSTKHALPITVATTFDVPNRKTAARIERWIKLIGASNFLSKYSTLTMFTSHCNKTYLRAVIHRSVIDKLVNLYS